MASVNASGIDVSSPNAKVSRAENWLPPSKFVQASDFPRSLADSRNTQTRIHTHTHTQLCVANDRKNGKAEDHRNAAEGDDSRRTIDLDSLHASAALMLYHLTLSPCVHSPASTCRISGAVEFRY